MITEEQKDAAAFTDLDGSDTYAYINRETGGIGFTRPIEGLSPNNLYMLLRCIEEQPKAVAFLNRHFPRLKTRIGGVE